MKKAGPIPREFWTTDAEQRRLSREHKRTDRISESSVEPDDSPEIQCQTPEIEHGYWRKEVARANKMAGPASVVAKSLKNLGSAAVLAAPGSNYEDIQFGLARSLEIDGDDQVWLPADGYVQGEADSEIEIEKFSQIISDLRYDKGLSLLGFYGVDFGPNPGQGTEGILSRVATFSLQNAIALPKARRLAIVGIGTGTTNQMEVFDSGVSATNKVHFPDLLRARFVYDRSKGIRQAEIPVSELPSSYLFGRDIPEPRGLRPEITTDFGGEQLP